MRTPNLGSTSMGRAAAWLLALMLTITALLGCSLVVNGELDGKEFGGRQDGGSGDKDASNDGATDDGGNAGSGGGGGGGGGGDDEDGGEAGAGGNDGGNAGTSGSGGGGEGSQLPPLMVVATNPADGDTTLYRYEAVQVMFSEDLAELEDSDIEVTHRESGDVVPGSVALADEHATFTPDSPMVVGGHYDVVIDESVDSTEGATLEDDYTFTFRIVAGFADDSDWIDRSDTPGGSEPDVGIDAAGNAIAIWMQQTAGGGSSYVSPWVARYTHGVGWGASRALDSDADGTAYSPKIAVAPDGTAFAVWTHDSGFVADPAEIMVARFDPTSGWGAPTALDGDPDKSRRSQEVAVAVNDNGQAVVAWSKGVDNMAQGQGNFFIMTYSDGTFGSLVPLVDDMNDPISGIGRIEAALTSDGLALLAGRLGFLGHSVYKQQAGAAAWTNVFDYYTYESVDGTSVALDENDDAYMGSNASEAGGVNVVKLVDTPLLRNVRNDDSDFDPGVAISADRGALAAWNAKGNLAATHSIWGITFDESDGDWALTATDLHPDRPVSSNPSAPFIPSLPDTASYLGTGGIVTWVMEGKLYSCEREGDGFGDATERTLADNPAVPWVKVAANEHGMGVMVWVERDPTAGAVSHIVAQTFRGQAP